MSEIRIDALLPPEMAARAEFLGVRKAEMPFLKMFMLSVLAGAFISLGAIFATTIGAGVMTATDAGVRNGAPIAAANSAAEWKRSAGAIASARMIATSTCGGTPAR